MEHFAAFMLLIACSDDLSNCRELPSPMVSYETVQTCDAEMEAAMRQYSNMAPTLLGKCVEIDPALFSEEVDLTWAINPEGNLEVAVNIIDNSNAKTIMAQNSFNNFPEITGQTRNN